jgi:membrane-bound metal-dependent hydrolase YbcI (DUF457 family)
MQLGHVAVALTISSFAPEITGGSMEALSTESIVVAMVAHWLPNLDGIPIMLGWAKPSFHCTWSHSILTAGTLAFLVFLFNPAWAVLGFVSLLIHFLADMPSSVGLPLFLPVTRKRFTLNLWADTGYFGWISFRGTYEQAWTWLLEGGAFFILLIRLYQLKAWPFI